MPGEKLCGPVNLLDEDYLRERVGQGEGGEPQEEFRLIFHLFVQAVGPADDKGGRFIQELRDWTVVKSLPRSSSATMRTPFGREARSRSGFASILEIS